MIDMKNAQQMHAHAHIVHLIMHILNCIRTYVHTYIHTHAYIHIYTHMHAYIHTYTPHTYIHNNLCVLAEVAIRDHFPVGAPMVMYQLRKEYPGTGAPYVAVDGMSLAIDRNECFGLLGPNGELKQYGLTLIRTSCDSQDTSFSMPCTSSIRTLSLGPDTL